MIYAILFLVSVIYAAVLETTPGRWLCEHRTWITVAVGTGYTLAAIPFLPPGWEYTLGAFAVAGTPMVARSLVNEWRREH